MKNKKQIAISALLASSFFVTSYSHANIPITRQSHDFLKLMDNQGVVSASVERITTSGAGIQSLSTEPVPNALYRGGSPTSRPNCGFDSSRNWSSEALVINAFRDCFNKLVTDPVQGDEVSVYVQAQRDLAHLIQNTTARSGYYSYTNPATINGEDRFVQVGVFLRANQSYDEARKIGINLSRSENATSIYAIYEHEKGFEPIGENMQMPGAGELRIYSMRSGDPEPSGDLTLLHSTSDSSFEVNMRGIEDHPDEGGLFDKSGAVNVLHYVGNYMDEYSASFAIVDYGNPLSPLLVEDPNEPGALSPLIEIETPERWYSRNECTMEDVMYGQRNETNTGVMYQRDRYTIMGDGDVARSARIVNRNGAQVVESTPRGAITFSEDVYDLAEARGENPPMLSVEHLNVHTYSYNTNISSFRNHITDPYGSYSSAPNNRFRIGDNDPFNNLHANIYQTPANVIDDSIIEMEYDVYRLVEEGYFSTRSRQRTEAYEYCYDVIRVDEDGEPLVDDDGEPTGETERVCEDRTRIVTDTETGPYYDTSSGWTYTNWVPPVYSKETRSACIHHTQEENFCETYNCDQTTPSYDPDGYITDKSLDENIQEDFYWRTGDWSGCNNNCGIGTQSRTVTCVSTVTGDTVGASNCTGERPITERSCPGNPANCSFEWVTGNWSNCSEACDGGIRTRDVYCRAPDGNRVPDSRCTGTKPSESGVCNTEACVYSYNVSGWSSCQANSSCIRTSTRSFCRWVSKEDYRCYSVSTTDDSSARSRGWLNNQMTTITGQRNDGFNGSHFRCTATSTSNCRVRVGRGKEAYSRSGTRTTTITYGQQSRNVTCVRENDNQSVHIGFCGPNQPKTHRICTRSTSIGGCNTN